MEEIIRDLCAAHALNGATVSYHKNAPFPFTVYLHWDDDGGRDKAELGLGGTFDAALANALAAVDSLRGPVDGITAYRIVSETGVAK